MITVLLADDQAMIRQAFTALLQLEADIRVVGQAGDVATGRRSQTSGGTTGGVSLGGERLQARTTEGVGAASHP